MAGSITLWAEISGVYAGLMTTAKNRPNIPHSIDPYVPKPAEQFERPWDFDPSKSEFPTKSTDQERRVAVRRTRFSVEQIVTILKQAEVGVPVADLVRPSGDLGTDILSLKEAVCWAGGRPGPSAAASAE